MPNNLETSLHVQQEQTLSPSQLQSLRWLNLPVQALETELTAALADNPLLELEAPPREELAGDPVGDALLADRVAERTADGSEEADFAALAETADDWGDLGGGGSEAEERARNYRLESLTAPVSLQSRLLEQLSWCEVDATCRRVAEMVIGSIDERGYLATPPADLAMAAGVDAAAVRRALALVQSFDPPGVGAADFGEALKLQLLRRDAPFDRRLLTLLDVHLPEIARNHLPAVAKAMKLSLDELHLLIAELKRLKPYPAYGLETAAVDYIEPEMSLEFHDGRLEIVDAEARVPRLGIVGRYVKMLDDPELPAETRAYLKNKLANAEALIKALQLRGSTIRRITEVIAATQADYFRAGDTALAPLTMSAVADRLELNESTVSRAVKDKYLATPQGLKPYSFFFTAGYRNAEGEAVSNRGVMARIRELVAAENPTRPLSDARIAAMLQSDGLTVARRTVAKYRESLNIPAASLRKKHG